jgi:hypothetical protein
VYKYRAIDQFGQVIDVLVAEKRDLLGFPGCLRDLLSLLGAWRGRFSPQCHLTQTSKRLHGDCAKSQLRAVAGGSKLRAQSVWVPDIVV